MIKSIIFSTSIFLAITFNGCESHNDIEYIPTFTGDIIDNQAWYAKDTALSSTVLDMRVNIANPNEYHCKPFDDLIAPSRPCTLADIDGDTDASDDYEPELHVQMETDDFESPDYIANAEFEQKGKSTRHANLKSYRIKLDSKTDLYNGERTFQLNKHPNDYSRVRNKLAFDFFVEIPNFTSLKTKFVNLEINGTDYGLFTHIEKVGDEFLMNHGFGKDDHLYKAQNFGFRYNSDLALDEDGKPINPELFDEIIEIENGKDHTKFVNMLQAIDNATTDAQFEVVFNKYFNRENYVTWMAINLVMANKDTVSQNFYLLILSIVILFIFYLGIMMVQVEQLLSMQNGN